MVKLEKARLGQNKLDSDRLVKRLRTYLKVTNLKAFIIHGNQFPVIFEVTFVQKRI